MTFSTPKASSADGPFLSADDVHWFNEGTHYRLYEKLGAHPAERDGVAGTSFGVWAPDAVSVSVMADFNGWSRDRHPLTPRGTSGLWEGFIPAVRRGAHYKYHVVSRHNGYRVDKRDPFAFHGEIPPATAAMVWELDYEWGDAGWMSNRGEAGSLERPISIYEVHLESWRHARGDPARWLGYREIAPLLADHVQRMGFTHVELLPIMEYPFGGSWGYQTTGYFAPTSRFGEPEDFMFFVDTLHQRGIGVILDWVPSHFPSDEHGLGYFDGSYLYEHADERQRLHPHWDTLVFNYKRNEVRSFLSSSAMFWLDRYHADGLRVDAVASMLYLDYGHETGGWVPNEYGGKENLDAVAFLRSLNEIVYREHPDVHMIAEESTAWPMVSRPTYVGGLGFGAKWDMGWMHDTLSYMSVDPVHRSYHQDKLTFRSLYAFTENFVLPLSHDEVVHGKGALVAKMPGDRWQKLANLRLLFGYMWAQPGKKLLFMGSEIAQTREWSHERGLDWHLLDRPDHRGVERWVADLNRLYRTEPALHELDFSPDGFEWVDCADHDQSIVSFFRKSEDGRRWVLAAFNFTPVPRHGYRLGVPRGGRWDELLNSDAAVYGGSGVGNGGGCESEAIPSHGRRYSLVLTLPPLAALFLGAEM